MLSVVLAVIAYLAFAAFVVGISRKLLGYARARGKMSMAVAPASPSRAGVVLGLLVETFFFRTLWRSDRLAWICGWVWHLCLFWLALKHVGFVLGYWPLAVRLAVSFGDYVAPIALIATLLLLLRRLLIERIRYVSSPSSYLWLAVFAWLLCTGMWLRHFERASLNAVHQFAASLIGASESGAALNSVESASVGLSAMFALHFVPAMFVLGLFPFSKLMHGVALWISPSKVDRQK